MSGAAGGSGRRLYVYARGTTSVPNATIADERLSYAALGLLLVILARPESASQGYRAYMARGTGQDSILKAFKQMADAGYRHQITKRTTDGRVETYTVVAEEPIPADIARDWLDEQLQQEDRAWHFHARRELRKRAKERSIEAKAAGDTVHGNAVHGDAVHGVPMHGQAVHGDAMHKPSVSKGPSSLRSQDHEEKQSDPPAERPVPPSFRGEFETRRGAIGGSHGP